MTSISLALTVLILPSVMYVNSITCKFFSSLGWLTLLYIFTPVDNPDWKLPKKILKRFNSGRIVSKFGSAFLYALLILANVSADNSPGFKAVISLNFFDSMIIERNDDTKIL